MENDKLYADSLTDTIEIPLNEDEEDEVYGDY